ncbi:hypothetical protein B0H14DRAFT_2616752 [Mycena olivaceomarginata]|nr:hypothetical protein B0H14DRAFT_2616752 [Mycena olivaceomarginata]
MYRCGAQGELDTLHRALLHQYEALQTSDSRVSVGSEASAAGAVPPVRQSHGKDSVSRRRTCASTHEMKPPPGVARGVRGEQELSEAESRGVSTQRDWGVARPSGFQREGRTGNIVELVVEPRIGRIARTSGTGRYVEREGKMCDGKRHEGNHTAGADTRGATQGELDMRYCGQPRIADSCTELKTPPPGARYEVLAARDEGRKIDGRKHVVRRWNARVRYSTRSAVYEQRTKDIDGVGPPGWCGQGFRYDGPIRMHNALQNRGGALRAEKGLGPMQEREPRHRKELQAGSTAQENRTEANNPE